jgi:DNA-binding phage protein
MRAHCACTVGLDEPLDVPKSHAQQTICRVVELPDLTPSLLHICHNHSVLAPMAKNTAHQAAVNALLSETERAEYARRVQALRSRNTLLTMLEATRETQGMTKRDLASRAGLEASSVRRLLTSATANPTTDNAFRLMAAMGISLEAKLPAGERVELVSPGAPATTAESAAAA